MMTPVKPTILDLSNRLCRALWKRRFLRSAWLAFRLALAYPPPVRGRLFDVDGDKDDSDSLGDQR